MEIDVIGVPMDLGAGRRGVDMGPSAIRYAQLKPELVRLGHTVTDLGNLSVPVAEESNVALSSLRYLTPILEVINRLAGRVDASLQSGHFPLILGGDHSLTLGAIRGTARTKTVGVIWIDAHGDFNTPATTPSGNIHGMPLAALAGYGDPRLVAAGQFDSSPLIDPKHIAIVGVRQLDPGERLLLREAGVTVLAMEQIDRTGLYTAFQRALEAVCDGTDGIYASLDLDALDPLYAPGVGTPVPGGLTYREAHTICELIAETGKLIGMDLVEVNPVLDEHNKTAKLAVELALSALGKRVWREQSKGKRAEE